MRKALFVLAAILLAGCESAASSPANGMQEAPEKTTESPMASTVTDETESIAKDQVVSFGNYQNQNIEWYVLAQEDGKELLLAMHAIDARPFNDGPSAWDQSSLRAWLNSDFYNEAFTAEEQQEIAVSSLDNGDDLGYGTTAGENTEDHVFLLSASQAQKYLSHEETVASPTDYALAQGAYVNESGNCAWWLRSPGMEEDGPAYYSSQGSIGTRAHKGSESIIGVRPAIWVMADAIN